MKMTRERTGLLIWALLFFNGLAFAASIPIVLPVPGGFGTLATEAALALATLLVLAFNRQHFVRPNLFLTLFSVLAAATLMTSVRMGAGPGMLLRAGRLCLFVALLWMLTPLWGRDDRPLLRWHITCLMGALATVVLGVIVSPGGSTRVDGRLYGQLWPIPPTQVGHYAAVLAGICFVLLISGVMRARRAWTIGGISVLLLLLTQTRTAVIGLLLGVACATISLVTVRRRARWTAIGAVVVVAVVVLLFAPAISHWYSRGQDSATVNGLNGRKQVWDELTQAPRSWFTEVFGIGQTDNTFNGHAIDNSWYATYQDDGLFGIVIIAAALVSLLMLAATRPRGPSVAVAVFIVVYCCVASTTETGLGSASPYLLDLTVAASLLAMPVTSTWTRDSRAAVTV
jgi:hypothetical protein